MYNQYKIFIMNTKFIYLTVLALALSFNSCSDSMREDLVTNKHELNISTLKKGESSEADSDFQMNANLSLEKINNHFSMNTLNKSDAIDYPDYYGGAYINDSGKLVVLIKGSPNRYKKNIEDIIGNQEVEFIACKNSYKDLNSIMKSLNSYKSDPSTSNNVNSKNFNLFHLDDVSNNIVVYLDDDSDAKKKDFKKSVYNSRAITFKKKIGDFVYNTTIYAGDKITSPKGAGSVGFRAKNAAGEEGIVTAGHVIDQYQTLSYNGSPIGICSVSKVVTNYDAAFIPITEPYLNVASNTITGTTNVLSTAISSPGVGTLVNKVGQKTGSTSGKILSTNASVSENGVTHQNLTSTNYTSDKGDSGGIVYSYVSSTNTRYTLGIHTGEYLAEGIRYYSKASYILSGLNITRY